MVHLFNVRLRPMSGGIGKHCRLRRVVRLAGSDPHRIAGAGDEAGAAGSDVRILCRVIGRGGLRRFRFCLCIDYQLARREGIPYQVGGCIDPSLREGRLQLLVGLSEAVLGEGGFAGLEFLINHRAAFFGGHPFDLHPNRLGSGESCGLGTSEPRVN